MKKVIILAVVSVFSLPNAEAMKIKIDSIELDASANSFFKIDDYKYGTGSLLLFPARHANTSLLHLSGNNTPSLKSQSSVRIDKEIEVPDDAEGLRVRTSGASTLASNPDSNLNVHEGRSYKIKLSNFGSRSDGRVGKTMDIMLEEIDE